MLRRIQQLLFILLALFVAYLLMVRGVITWVQYAPEQFLSYVEQWNDSTIKVEKIAIDQSWLGLDFEVQNVSYEDSTRAATLASAKGDLNIFSPFFPDMSFGNRLGVSGLQVDILSLDESKDDDASNEMDIWQIVSENWKSLSINKIWKVVNLEGVSFSSKAKENGRVTLGIDSFQAYRGLKWSFGGVLSVHAQQELSTQLQVKGDFDINLWGKPEEGSFSAHFLTPLNLANLYQVMPETWIETLPTGEILGDLSLDVKKGELSKLNITSNAQDLTWPENDHLLPKSIGIGLNWVATNQFSGNALENWQFELEKIRFGKEYLKTISPIYLSLKNNRTLKFQADKVDFNVLKPFFKLLTSKFDYQGFGKNLKALSLKNVEGLLNLDTLDLKYLTLQVPSIQLPADKNLPGLALNDLKVEKNEKDIWLKTPHPINLSINVISSNPIALNLKEGLHLKLIQQNHQWQTKDTRFTLNSMPVNLTATGDFSGKLDLDMTIEPDKLSFVKQYLPYDLMSSKLENWLKTALVKGEGIKGRLRVKGDLNDFPFRHQEGLFEATADIHKAELKFQPDWPALEDFSAKLRFTPYDLQITSEQVMLGKMTGHDVVVDINALDTKNIAVQVKGKAEGNGKEAVAYFLKTPLAEKIGMASFLQEHTDLSGPVSVDLPKIWIPVYGYDKKEESVKGQVDFNKVALTLYDRLTFKDVQGRLNFTEQKVSAQKISALFQDGRVHTSIETQNDQAIINSEGEATFNEALYQGRLPWKTAIQIPFKSKNRIKVIAEADLTHLVSALPAPLSDESLRETHIRPKSARSTIQVGEDALDIQFTVGDLIKGKTQYSFSDESFNQFVAIVGGSQSVPALDSGNNFFMTGQLDKVNLDEWMRVWPQIKEKLSLKLPSSKNQAPQASWQGSNLHLNKVILADYDFNDINLNWITVKEKEQSSLAMSIKGPDIDAVANELSNGDYEVKLSKLNMISPVKNPEELEKKKPCKESDGDVVSETKVYFQGNNINLNGKKIAHLSFNMTDTTEMLTLSKINIQPEGVKGVFNGRYQYSKVNNISHLSGKADSNDVENLTLFLGLKKGFKGKKAEMTVNLNWKGNYQCYSLIGLKGDVSFTLQDGVIKDAEPGIARLIGLLSFESLARRLQLNIKDVTDAGLAYDSIKGEGQFNRGVFGFEKLNLKAPAAKAKVFGEVNLIQKELDLSAEITPSIGSSLPAIAAISGLATPIAGLAAYAFMKIVPIVNEDLVTYRYEVKGTFEAPDIKAKGLNLDLINLKGQSDIKGGSILDSE
ncbi:TIGR02099 family protein [Hydrogenovibrio crunogenus]|uniref:TIGR02099 family protein n=1 Tax=Hydrogenovibrio crunogenus TaxID=39765 RepID=A0A4P7P134_9GAMM|nr:DUF3971 domain-containing protein [Hydrogenovibrio crunogenus]QBZ83535.1 TIGR02099 family protein [Hydrogenovibrio crunogenus]